MPDTPTDESKPVTGRTWADLMAAFPIWLLGVAAISFVGLMAHAILLAKEPRQLGPLGTWGPTNEPSQLDGIPLGAVVAFDFDIKSDAGCPNGWEFFEAGGGRTIVGAGDHNNKWYPRGSNDPVSVTIYPTYLQDARAGVQESAESRATGGEEKVLLIKDEMPRHDHPIGSPEGEPLKFQTYTFGGVGNGAQILHLDGEETVDYYQALNAGSSLPHNNMPPFIALYFCKKI